MPYTGYLLILALCIVVSLASFNRIGTRWFPFILYGVGLSMVLTTTLAGPYLVGTDIHLEYYYVLFHDGGNVLPPLVGLPPGTSILNYLPSSIWIYKLVYPFFYSFIPIILYFTWKKWLTPKQSFLASFFFIALPPFFLEIPQIPQEMVAEVPLALCLFFIFKSNLSFKSKVPLLVVLVGLISLTHYSIGIVAIILFSCILLFSLLMKQKERKLLAITLVALLLVSGIFFSIAQDGAVIKDLHILYRTIVPWAPAIPNMQPVGGLSIPTREYSPLFKAALGIDFMKVNLAGKALRVVQWGILALLGLGLWKLKKSRNYLVFASGGILILLLCIIPKFSDTLNITRIAHLSLFLIAPVLAISLKPKYLLPVLVIYFLFSSGFVFEVTKQPMVEDIGVPMNIGLSDYRIDLGATLTKDDIEVRQYIFDNNLYPVYSDFYGGLFIQELIGTREGISKDLWNGEINGYVFVRSRVTKEGKFSIWTNKGTRKFVDPEVYGIDLSTRVIYQSGDSKVLKVGK